MGIIKKYNETSLIIRIICGMIIGVIIGLVLPGWTWVGMFGTLFVGALRAVAPVLVFILVCSALCQGSSKLDARFGNVIALYLIATVVASLLAVTASFLFPVKLQLTEAAEADTIVQGFGEVVKNILNNVVQNPISALAGGNYLGILFWAAMIGLGLKRYASVETQRTMQDLADAVSQCVRWVINVAPFGIMGLMYSNISENGMSIFKDYGQLLLLLVCTMLASCFITNPLICFLTLRRNPYPLLWRTVKDSGITAFFSRSSAANIPINMALCERMGLDKDFYSVSIPLGATINMNGAAITIAIMTLACCNTVGANVDIGSAVILCILSAFAACGASGVTGGSLLLIPMACSLFGISNEIAMQVVGVGFIVGVIQDSLETALNSSSDAYWTATAEFKQWIKNGEELPTWMGGKRVVEEK